MIRREIVVAVALALMMPIGTSPLRSIAAAAVSPAAHLALVIGNATYARLPTLPGCTVSAHLVTATLKRAGFSVTEKLDQTNGEMSGALGALADAVAHQPGASVVVYVCGYAMTFDGRAFLLPVSAAVEDSSDALTQGIVAKSLINAFGRVDVSAGLVLLDAVAQPGGTTPLSFASATSGDGGKIAAALASAPTPPPQEATAFAAAIASALEGPNIETSAALQTLKQRLATAPGVEIDFLAPSTPQWLAGGPSPASNLYPTPAPAQTPPAQSASAPAPANLPDEAHMTDADRRQIQAALLRLGYYAGRVDGVFGADTRAAIRRFQHEIKAEMTGEINSQQASRLLAEIH